MRQQKFPHKNLIGLSDKTLGAVNKRGHN